MPDDSPFRAMPSCLDTERAVLACALRDPHLVPRIQACLGGGEMAAHAFYTPAHRSIWAGMEALYRTKITFDLITLRDMLAQCEELTSVGGVGYLAQLVDDVPSAGLLDHYLETVIDRAARRVIIQKAGRLANQAYDLDQTRLALIDEAERTLFSLRELGTDKGDRDGPRRLATVLTDDVVPAIEAAYKNRGKTTRGLPTGYHELDRMTLGLERSKLYIIAARPAMGKTSLAMNIAQHVASGPAKMPVLVFSLEMSAEELAQRMLTAEADLDIYRLRDGFMSQIHLGQMATAAAKLGAVPLFIDDPSDLKIHDLRSRARRAVAQHGIGLVIVDYLQLIHGSSKQAETSRTNEVSEVSRGLKAMAKELGVPVIALCQLNRNADERRHGVPKLSDLRESGSIEQDADLVGLLYRPAYYEKDAEERERISHMAFLDIAKQRSGATGGGDAYRQKYPEWNLPGCPGIPLHFHPARVRFENPEGAEKLYN